MSYQGLCVSLLPWLDGARIGFHCYLSSDVLMSDLLPSHLFHSCPCVFPCIFPCYYYGSPPASPLSMLLAHLCRSEDRHMWIRRLCVFNCGHERDIDVQFALHDAKHMTWGFGNGNTGEKISLHCTAWPCFDFYVELLFSYMSALFFKTSLRKMLPISGVGLALFSVYSFTSNEKCCLCLD